MKIHDRLGLEKRLREEIPEGWDGEVRTDLREGYVSFIIVSHDDEMANRIDVSLSIVRLPDHFWLDCKSIHDHGVGHANYRAWMSQQEG